MAEPIKLNQQWVPLNRSGGTVGLVILIWCHYIHIYNIIFLFFIFKIERINEDRVREVDM